MKELMPPEEALADADSVELLRVWLSHDNLLTALRPLEFENGAVTFGMVIADIARHTADMLYKRDGYPKAETLSQICQVFLSEMKSDAGGAVGGFLAPTPQ